MDGAVMHSDEPRVVERFAERRRPGLERGVGVTDEDQGEFCAGSWSGGSR